MWLLFVGASPALDKFCSAEVTLGGKKEVLSETIYEGLSYGKYNCWPALEYTCSPQIFPPVTILQLMHLNMD